MSDFLSKALFAISHSSLLLAFSPAVIDTSILRAIVALPLLVSVASLVLPSSPWFKMS